MLGNESRADRHSKGRPAIVVLQSSVGYHLRSLAANDSAARRGTPDAVHQLRVDIRRLRSELRCFAVLVDSDWETACQAELAWLADELGPARELEVLVSDLSQGITRLPASVDHDAVAALVSRRYGARLEAASARALASLRSARYRRLIEALLQASRSMPASRAGHENGRQALAPLVEETWKTLRRRVERLSDCQPTAAGYHRARIAAKRCRYCAEVCIPLLGSPAEHLACAAREVHDLLGIHRDAVIAAAAIQTLVTGSDATAQVAFALGLLHAGQEDRAKSALRKFHERWPAIEHEARAGWPR